MTKPRWKFARSAYTQRPDGLYYAIGDLDDGRGLIIDIRHEDELPPEPTGQILINIKLKVDDPS